MCFFDVFVGEGKHDVLLCHLDPYPYFFFLAFFFRAAPSAYFTSWARGQIGATVASLHHSTAMWDPSHVYDLHHSSWQHWILDPLSKDRDSACIFMDASHIRF